MQRRVRRPPISLPSCWLTNSTDQRSEYSSPSSFHRSSWTRCETRPRPASTCLKVSRTLSLNVLIFCRAWFRSDEVCVIGMWLGTCEAARFDSNSNRLSDLIRFDSKVIGWCGNFRIQSAVPAPLLIVSLVKQLKPLTALSGTVYRLASSMSDHTPVV